MGESIHTVLETAAESILMEFGEVAQTIKACEEMAELTTQLCKGLNGSPTTHAAVVDEIADTLIMVFQMRHHFGKAAVDERILYKLNRTLNFIRARNRPTETEEKELAPC